MLKGYLELLGGFDFGYKRESEVLKSDYPASMSPWKDNQNPIWVGQNFGRLVFIHSDTLEPYRTIEI